jgi:hypothetical protein
MPSGGCSLGQLLAEVQQALFEAAIGSAGEGSREKLAITPDVAERQAGERGARAR